LIDFCLASLVIVGFSNAGAILSNCSKFALSPIEEKKIQMSFEFYSFVSPTGYFDDNIRDSGTQFIG
jgi:hypothetical protein